MESPQEKRERAERIYAILDKYYPGAKVTLDFTNPFELAVATILSAQCTDERVNMVTPALFKRFPDAKSMAAAGQAAVEELIKSCGFYHNKAKNIVAMSAVLAEKYSGKVPSGMDELTALPGIGRKTANVIRGNAFDKPAIIVDTHCKRVTHRLGFTTHTDPAKIEADLAQVWPQERWTHFSNLMLFHGRKICRAPRPLCPKCPVNSLCPYPDKTQ